MATRKTSRKSSKNGSPVDVYELVNNQFKEIMAKGEIPWRKTWTGGMTGFPQNFYSKNYYRGVNTLILSMMHYSLPYWISFKQAGMLRQKYLRGLKKTNPELVKETISTRGKKEKILISDDKTGMVKKGASSMVVVFWKFLEKNSINEETGEPEKGRFPMLRYYRVFNITQLENYENLLPKVEKTEPEKVFNPIEEAEKIVAGYEKQPKIQYEEQAAYYRPSADLINMPKPESFELEEEYYATLFHEMAHSTGHKKRLDRGLGTNYHGDGYSKEELVAEITAAYLSNVAGIGHKTIENSAAYLQSWLKKIGDNPKWLVCAAGSAQKASDLVLGVKFEKSETE